MSKPLGPMADPASDSPDAPLEVEPISRQAGAQMVVLPDDAISGLLRPFNGRARGVILALLRGTSIGMAAAAAGIDTDTMRRWRKRQPEFDEACRKAQDWGFAQVYESELYDRAMDREDRASGRLLEMVVKSRSADYREKQQVQMDVIHRAVSAQTALVAGWDSDEEADTSADRK